ncbi:MAG: alpha/beta fold hydrolase [Anaerolineae bacterium]|nr:alpha/beta fold hydrolase [Anaerolineae bacterium]
MEDDDNPDGATIRTAVIIIHSRQANPSKEAMLFTEGGPGFSSLPSVWWLADTDFADHRDIVILEQRGNKYAEPSLACDFLVWDDETGGETPCLDSLRQRGIALENYTTAAIAADINALKQALDYESWILYGTSYSARPVQLAMATYPEHIRGVVLHSTSPVADTRYRHDPEHAARVLGVMFDDCTADPTCAQAYPDLENRFYELVQKLNDEPVALEMAFPGSAERLTMDVDGGALISWMVEGAFYGPAYPPFETAYLPLLIDRLSRGNRDLLYPWAKAYLGRWGSDDFTWGLYLAINCQDDASSVTPEMVKAQVAAYPELDGYYRFGKELEICAAWQLDPAPPLASEPVASDIPTLVLAGRYDPITPPEWSRAAVANLSNRTFVAFPASGHSVNSDNPCAQQITTAFLDNPGQTLDLSCVQAAPRPEFVLGSEIIIAPAMYEIHYGELGYSMLEEKLFLGSWLTLIGTGIVALIVGLVNLVRRRSHPPADAAARLAHPLLIALPVTALIWGVALRFTLQSVAATAPNVLRFGLPAACWWIFAVAILIGLMTIGLIVIAAWAWKRGYWSLIGRIAISLTTLAAIVFSGMLAYWGMFTALFR